MFAAAGAPPPETPVCVVRPGSGARADEASGRSLEEDPGKDLTSSAGVHIFNRRACERPCPRFVPPNGRRIAQRIRCDWLETAA